MPEYQMGLHTKLVHNNIPQSKVNSRVLINKWTKMNVCQKKKISSEKKTET